MNPASTIIADSGVQFGTSGARGLVSDFSAEVCAAFTLAFLDSQITTTKLAIAIDNRPSSPAIAQACIAAAKHCGLQVEYYGVVPTPALALTAVDQQIPAIMVTGSHIPFDRNGLKFYRSDGEISKADEALITQSAVSVTELGLEPLPDVNPKARDYYLQRYLQAFPQQLLQGKRIGIYEHSSAGRDLYAELFQQLGGEVVCFGRSDEFVPIDTEALSPEDRARAKSWQQQYELDAIFSTDGDGDRPMVFDQQGEFIKGDILCLLAAKSLGIEALAVPISCNSAIEESGLFKKVVRTRIGSPYVIAAIDSLLGEFSSVAGFEANGGFLLASNVNINSGSISALPTRDAVLPFLGLMSLANNVELSSVVNDLPQCYTDSDRIKGVEKSVSAMLLDNVKKDPHQFLNELGLDGLALQEINELDGLRLAFDDQSVIHLRPSGNAPELRCYTEANSTELAAERLQLAIGWLQAKVAG